MQRLSRFAVFVLLAMPGLSSLSAGVITVFITENGGVAFSNGTPLAGSGYSPSQGTIVLCDGATNTNNPATATSCAAGVSDSDIVNFGGNSNNIVMQSDRSAGDTDAADLLAFSVQYPGNTVFLAESAPNPSGIERTDFTPTARLQPGYAADANGNTLGYEIVSDEDVTPEPSTLLLAASAFAGILLIGGKKFQRDGGAMAAAAATPSVRSRLARSHPERSAAAA